MSYPEPSYLFARHGDCETREERIDMAKTISFFGGAGAFLILSLLTPAQTAPPAPLNARALGALEGTLNFCGKINPESADKYKEMGKLLTKGQTAEALAEKRGSQEYKDSLDQISKHLEGLSTKEALATCKAQAK
jgi:hypothetical protein